MPRTTAELMVADGGCMPSKETSAYWSLSVPGNCRLIVRFEEGDAFDLDLLDYH
jgi:hypothetical protein